MERQNANLGTRKKSFEKARRNAEREEEMKECGPLHAKGLQERVPSSGLRSEKHTAEFVEKFGDPDSAEGCTRRSQTNSKMSVFHIFVLATFSTSFFQKTFEVKKIFGQFVTYSIKFA